MQVQSYLVGDPAMVSSAKTDEGQAALEERMALLEFLNFEKLHKWEKLGAGKLEKAKLLYAELSRKELDLWRCFLPTMTTAQEFIFDDIPLEALGHIKTATDLSCFDRIEIWTPEGNSFVGALARSMDSAKETIAKLGTMIDPMAVGVVKDKAGIEHYFPIARWGEALLPLAKIKRHVWSVNWRLRLLLVILPALLACFTVAAYLNAIQLHGYIPTVVVPFVVFVILFVIVAFVAASGGM